MPPDLKYPSFLNLARWKNVAYQVFNLGVGGILLLGIWMFLGRSWGPDIFGRFSYMYAYASLYGIFSDIGSDILAARITAEKQGIPKNLLTLKLIILFANFLIFMFAGLMLDMELFPLFFFLSGVAALSFCSFLNGILRGCHRLDIEARIGIVQKTIFAAIAVIGCLYWRFSIPGVSAAYFTSQFLGLALTIYGVWRYLQISAECSRIYPLLKALFALWVISLWGMVYLRLDFFMIERFLGSQALGYFSMPFKIWEGCMLMATAYLAAVFPRFVENKARPSLLSSMLARSVILLFSVGAVAGLSLALSGGYAFDILFEGSYGPSKIIINTLFPLMPLAYVSGCLGIFLIALSRERIYAILLTMGFIVHVSADLFLVEKWGITGAVAGNWIREVFLLTCLSFSVRAVLKEMSGGKDFNSA